MPFEMQPIMAMNDPGEVGFEMLYRGSRPHDWTVVDRSILQFLIRTKISLPHLSVNLANSSIANLPAQMFIDAASRSKAHFELSDDATDPITIEATANIINGLTAQKVNFSIDGFGTGFDGFARLCMLDKVASVKIDGALILRSQQRDHARNTLKTLVAHWNLCGIRTIAQCIETHEIHVFAKELGFQFVQGWYIDSISPLSFEDYLGLWAAT